jgi:hypothetical protein
MHGRSSLWFRVSTRPLRVNCAAGPETESIKCFIYVKIGLESTTGVHLANAVILAHNEANGTQLRILSSD